MLCELSDIQRAEGHHVDADPNEKVSANEAAAVLLPNSQREFLQGSVYHHGGSLGGKCEAEEQLWGV